MGKIEVEDFAFKLFRILVLVQEIGLTLALTINGYNHVSKRLHVELNWLNKARDWDLLNCLGFLLVKLYIIECNQIVSTQDEIKIVSNHERHLKDSLGLWELKANFFSLPLLKKQQSHFGGSYL